MYFGIRLRHFRIEGLFIIPKMPKENEQCGVSNIQGNIDDND
jgi:hypothetical protein